jgi:protein SCO1/2
LAGPILLLTVTFDPEFDTPQVLRTWGKRYFKTFDRSTLATGAPDEIRRLATFLSVEYEAEDEGDITHNLRTAVVGRDGRLLRLFRGNDWTPEDLLAELKTAAAS